MGATVAAALPTTGNAVGDKEGGGRGRIVVLDLAPLAAFGRVSFFDLPAFPVGVDEDVGSGSEGEDKGVVVLAADAAGETPGGDREGEEAPGKAVLAGSLFLSSSTHHFWEVFDDFDSSLSVPAVIAANGVVALASYWHSHAPLVHCRGAT